MRTDTDSVRRQKPPQVMNYSPVPQKRRPLAKCPSCGHFVHAVAHHTELLWQITRNDKAQGILCSYRQPHSKYEQERAKLLKLGNWSNTNDAPRPTQEVLEAAQVFLSECFRNQTKPSKINPTQDGGVAFIFQTATEDYLSVEFDNEGETVAGVSVRGSPPEVWNVASWGEEYREVSDITIGGLHSCDLTTFKARP